VARGNRREWWDRLPSVPGQRGERMKGTRGAASPLVRLATLSSEEDSKGSARPRYTVGHTLVGRGSRSGVEGR
jgi:hypothetical protein